MRVTRPQVKPRAREAALQAWLRAQGSLAVALSNPRLPASMRPKAQGAWEAMEAGAPSGAGAAGAGGSGVGAGGGGEA